MLGLVSPSSSLQRSNHKRRRFEFRHPRLRVTQASVGAHGFHSFQSRSQFLLQSLPGNPSNFHFSPYLHFTLTL